MSCVWNKLIAWLDSLFTPAEFRAVTESLLCIVVIIVVAWLSVRIINRAIDRMLTGDKGKLLPISGPRVKTLQALLRSCSRYLIYFIAGTMILARLGVEPASLLTTAGILGLVVGFAAQNLVRDVITGFFILFEDLFAVGDYIRTAGVSGTVEKVGLRSTWLRDGSGELHAIPNGQITQITNCSRGQMRARG